MTMLSRTGVRALAGLVLLTFFAGCGGEAADPFRVGVLVLADPPYEHASGVSTAEAVQLYADSVNEAGGVLIGGVTRPIEIVVAQHSFHVEEATTAARRLLNLSGVHAFIGPQLSDHAIPVAGIADRAGIPMISPMSSNPETTRDRPFVFRVAFVDDVQSRVLAQVAREDLGIQVAGVLYDRASTYSASIAQQFAHEFTGRGGDAILTDFAGSEAEDVRTELTEMMDAGVQAILLPNQIVHVESILRQARELGLGIRFLGTDGWDVRRLLLEPAAQGAVVTHQWSPDLDSPETVAFLARYRDRWGHEPRTTAALTYDAIHILVQAAVSAGSLDGDSIRQALAEMPPVRGVSGIVDFTPGGDPDRSVMVTIIEDGSYRLHRKVDHD